MFVLKRANIACRQQMTTVNLPQKYFKQLSYYTASNRYYILIQLLPVTKSSIILQQTEGIFWRCSMAFRVMLCLQIYYGLLLSKHLPRTREKLERDCLWKVIKASWLVKYSSKFVFIDRRRSWNSECPGL